MRERRGAIASRELGAEIVALRSGRTTRSIVHEILVPVPALGEQIEPVQSQLLGEGCLGITGEEFPDGLRCRAPQIGIELGISQVRVEGVGVQAGDEIPDLVTVATRERGLGGEKGLALALDVIGEDADPKRHWGHEKRGCNERMPRPP